MKQNELQNQVVELKKLLDDQHKQLDSATEDFRMREQNLVQANQKLKEENQKLQKFALPPTSQDSSTPDAVNYQYLKNVVLRFLVDPVKRPQLVPVLASIMNFSKEEQERIKQANQESLLKKLTPNLISPK
jgi:chromosome segregation ATPase